MSIVSLAKNISRRTGSYRQAQWVFRKLIRPDVSTFYKKEVEFYSSLIGPGDLCFDIGASVGRKSEVFLQMGASVVAFEPQEDSFRELKNRCEDFPGFRPLRSAMGSEVGEIEMYIRDMRSTSSVRSDWEGDITSIINVPVTTLDKAIENYGKPKFCKIDVEGYELEVLHGLSHPIENISFEYHRNEFDKAIACLEYLEKMGEYCVNITPAEQSCFGLEEWCDKDEFTRMFEGLLIEKKEYNYGDIFVKLMS